MRHPPHTLVVGETQSGKGQFVRSIAEARRAQGFPVLYYSSKLLERLDVECSVDWVTGDAGEFYERARTIVESGREVVLMIDEAKKFQKTHALELETMLCEWAAYGCQIYVIVQRAMQVFPDVRTNCGAVVSFLQGEESSAKIAKEFSCRELMEATQLKKGHYLYYKDAFTPVQRGCSFWLDENDIQPDGKPKFHRVRV